MPDVSRLPAPIQEAWEWQYRGACREADPQSFFSPETERGPLRRAREAVAKSYCGRCPVVSECLQHALDVKEPYGVWGGLNATERGHLLRKAG